MDNTGLTNKNTSSAVSIFPTASPETRRLYVAGGKQRTAIKTDEWHQYGKGVVIGVNLDSGTTQCCVEYETLPQFCAPGEPSITFKAGTVKGNLLYICTSTEVLVYELPYFKQVGYLSLPCFNDLHHVCPNSDGNLLIANTGLDMVIEVAPNGQITREWNVVGDDPWARFSRQTDYRRIASTKPHKAHPNFVFKIDDEIWVTRFEQRDAISLSSPDRRIEIGVQRPHDGAIHNDFIYFTTVDGHVVIANKSTLKVEELVDLNLIEESDILLGWCRGLKMVDERRIWVGFSRFRPTKFLENVSWIKNGFRKVRKPTHISLYDVVRRECIEEIDLEPSGINTIFSIFEEPDFSSCEQS